VTSGTPHVALITGAAGAIGRAVVSALARDGARVAAVDIEPGAGGAELLALRCDIADCDAIAAAVADVTTRWGSVDILVNTAGVFDTFGSTLRIDPAAWDRDIRVMLSGPFYATRAVLPGMLAHGWGRIVNVSSMSSRGAYKQASYGAAKEGLIGLTKTVALEFAAAGITANAVLPGLIDTPKVAHAPADILREAVAAIPAARLGTPEEVADLVAYLASDAAAYVNGAAVVMDGGTSLLQLRVARKSSLR
jgi:NAD(P)-dependent dehydrogenase (short-subunit alcohol dehydrogenase family)